MMSGSSTPYNQSSVLVKTLEEIVKLNFKQVLFCKIELVDVVPGRLVCNVQTKYLLSSLNRLDNPEQKILSSLNRLDNPEQKILRSP